MTERGAEAQQTGKKRLWPMIMLIAGLIVFLASIVGAFTSQFWEEHYGLPWRLLSNMLLLGLGTGTISTLHGLHLCWGPPENKPDPLEGIQREIAGLRQEVAALRVLLEDGA